MDLIERQAVLDALWLKYCNRPLDSDRYLIKDIRDIINSLPSAQPEIIRCKDCKWSDWYTSLDGSRYCYCMETSNGGRTEDDYCSYAERETDG